VTVVLCSASLENTQLSFEPRQYLISECFADL
jgi:hypothetical protein